MIEMTCDSGVVESVVGAGLFKSLILNSWVRKMGLARGLARVSEVRMVGG